MLYSMDSQSYDHLESYDFYRNVQDLLNLSGFIPTLDVCHVASLCITGMADLQVG